MSGKTAPRLSGGNPLVGYVSTTNSIDVVKTNDHLIVKVARGTRTFVLFALTLLGPVAAVAVALNPNPHTPALLKILFYLFAGVCTLILLCTITTRPRLVIDRVTGDVAYFRRGDTPARVMRRADIATVRVSNEAYISDAVRVDNRVLSIVTSSGEVVRLCASPNIDLIASLARDVAAITRTTLLNNSNEQVTE